MNETYAILAVGLLGALLAAILVYLLQARRREQLGVELEDSRREAAVSNQKLADLADRCGHETRLREEEEQRRVASQRALSVTESDLRLAEQRLVDLTTLRDELRVAADESAREQRFLGKQVADLGAELVGLRTERKAQADKLEEQKLWFEQQTQHFEQRVVAIAAKQMEERGRVFTETNRKEVENVVAPFRERLQEFQRKVEHIYDQENKDRGALVQQIVQLTSLNRTVSEKTEQLTNALTIQSKSTGSWGETILARILEDSGLRRDREYRLQVSIKGPDGEAFMPDAVIDLPEKRQLIVDSKVSNKAWTEYCSAGSDEAARASSLALHLQSLRAHLKSLASKDYSRSPDLNTVDFVLMFVPVEAALLTALQEDDSLYSDAYRSKVILVTPSTLMAVVKLAEGLWTLQKRKESADEIAEAGRKLYEKLSNFAQTFVDVGAAIEDAQRTYDKARGQLATGKGNAIRLAEQLKELGVTPAAGKGMPAPLLEHAEESTGESSRYSGERSAPE